MDKKMIAGLVWVMVFVLTAPGLVLGGLSNAEKLEAAYSMYADYKQEFPFVMDISPKAAMEEMKSGKIVFVDTRKLEEMKVSSLPHAISQKEYIENRKSYEDKKIVVYCTISYRSGLFAKQMKDEGVTIYNLQGGIVAWVLEGGKVYEGEHETKRVHVYGKKWNFLPDGYEAVMFGLLDRMRF